MHANVDFKILQCKRSYRIASYNGKMPKHFNKEATYEII